MRARAGCLALAAILSSLAQSAEPFKDCEACPRMAVIAPASYEMGSPESSTAGNGDETPLHKVSFARPFAVGVNEITRGEFAHFVAETGYDTGDECQVVRDDRWQLIRGVSWRHPGFDQTDDHPVVCVSWIDAARFVEWLSQRSGKRYRLLSEAEWEYLAKSAAIRPVDATWTNYLADDRWRYTAPVGSFGKDGLGINDVLGNVWEWLEDCYHESYDGAPADGSARTDGCAGKRSVRGGSYGDAVDLLRPAYRLRGPEDGRYATLGFRVARNLD